MIEGRHFQQAYITRDVDAAMARLKDRADVRFEAVFQTPTEVTVPGAQGLMECRIALLWVGDLQLELIQPISGLTDLYSAALPAGDEIVFHHVCMRVDDWDGFRARVDRQPWPVVLEGRVGGLHFLYLDARPLLGHYVEYAFFPPKVWTLMGGR